MDIWALPTWFIVGLAVVSLIQALATFIDVRRPKRKEITPKTKGRDQWKGT